jgi:hypothetical protein
MSDENVELVRAAVDAFNRGNLEWLLERIDDDFEFDWTRSRGPLAWTYRGPDGLPGTGRSARGNGGVIRSCNAAGPGRTHGMWLVRCISAGVRHHPSPSRAAAG